MTKTRTYTIALFAIPWIEGDNDHNFNWNISKQDYMCISYHRSIGFHTTPLRPILVRFIMERIDNSWRQDHNILWHQLHNSGNFVLSCLRCVMSAKQAKSNIATQLVRLPFCTSIYTCSMMWCKDGAIDC